LSACISWHYFSHVSITMHQKASTSGLVLFLLLFCSTNGFAQYSAGDHLFTFERGYSVTSSALTKAFDLADDPIEKATLDLNHKAVFGFGYEYILHKRVGFGLNYAYQPFTGSVTGHVYTNLDGEKITENVDFNLRRNVLFLNARFLIPMKIDKLDLYAGVRVGMLYWRSKFETSNPNFDKFKTVLLTRPLAGITVGARYFPIPNVGLKLELAHGAPAIASAGVTLRLGGKTVGY
jgi:hypothetical protein